MYAGVVERIHVFGGEGDVVVGVFGFVEAEYLREGLG